MTNLFNMLNESAKKETKSAGNSDFGNLVDKENYHFEIIEAKAGLNSGGNPMLTLNVKTITGATGVGTKIRAWYTLDTDANGALVEGKEFQSKQLMQLAGAINVDIDDILADDYAGFLKEFAARIMEAPAKTFMATVNAKPDYTAGNGKVYKQWGLNQFSVAPIDAINTTVAATPAKTTSADEIKDQFGFDV